MAGNPHPWLRDDEPVEKSEARAHTPLTIGSVEQLEALDGSTFWIVFILELDAQFVRKPSDTTTPADGVTCIRDANGQAWKIVQTVGGVEIHAAGLADDRDDFDDEEPPFVYYAIDEELAYVKNSAASADWSEGFAIKGPPGNDGNDSEVPGPAGADGADPGYLLNFEAGTSAPPTAGGIRFNNADLSAATEAYVSKTQRGGSSIAARLAELFSSDRTVKDTFALTNPADEKQASFVVNGITDETGYVTFAIGGHAGETAFAAGAISFQPNRAGADGADGLGTGDVTAAANIADNALVVGDGGTKGIKAHASGPPGDAAFKNTGTTAGTVAAGDDSRIVNSVPNSRAVSAGTGLSGGGDLSADRTLSVDKASDANVRAAAADKVLTADLIETASALVALSDAATVDVDWDAGVAFSLTVADNRTIGNPTNGQPGTFRVITVQGNDGTDRTLSFGNQFKGDLPAITDCDSATWYDLYLRCITTTHFTVTAHKSNKP